MTSNEITINRMDKAKVGGVDHVVFYGLQRGKVVRVLMPHDEWDLFLMAHGGKDGIEARADLARIAEGSEPFRIEVDGVPEYMVRYMNNSETQFPKSG